MERISEAVYRVPAVDEPLSADIGVVYAGSAVWLYDVGAIPGLLREIDTRGLPVFCVLSHFHPDHIAALGAIAPERLFLGANTFKYVGRGEIVREDILVGDVRVFPLPSSHAKGSLGLEFGGYAFLGDGICSCTKGGREAYNTGVLGETIKRLKSLSAEYFLLSHDEKFVRKRGEVIAELEEIFSTRTKDSAFIYV